MTRAEEQAGVPALVVTPEKAPVVSGNFEQIETYLQTWRAQIASIEMTEENMAQVRLIKKESVAYRSSLTKIQNDIKKTYFNDPKAVFERKMGNLLTIVSDVEKAADEVLAIEERERVDSINQVIDHYIEKFQKQYSLDEEHVARIERKKSYYNKTAEEKERKDDIEQQFKDLKKDQEARVASIRLIKTTCAEEPRLNVQHWIDKLQYEDVATITEAIVAEKQRLRELDKQETEPPALPDILSEATNADKPAEKIVIGIPSHLNFASDFRNRTKSLRIEIIYPCDLGEELSKLFTELKQYGIKVRQLKEEVVA
jgi:hypothetical protein